ncbi:cobalt transporter [Herbaspirillum lusitanum]|uniref:Cobalt transporter n=1 Tax=Herbaspirillum lusitanum TaxID=213312 RepID=A0ABW9AED3_9BURK
MQLSWAAVASYCQNESSQASYHFGHHEHQDAAKSVSAAATLDTLDSADNSKAPDNAKADVECGLCHVSCYKSVCSYPQLKAPAEFQPALHLPLPSTFSSHIADGPEKPNWQLAA